MIDLNFELAHHEYVVVDFYATWCGPCKMFGPVFDQIAKEYESRARFLKIAYTEDTEALCQKYGVTSVPSTIIFKNGEQVKMYVGPMDSSTFRTFLENQGI